MSTQAKPAPEKKQKQKDTNNAAPYGVHKQDHPDAKREQEARERQEGKPAVRPKKG